MARRKISHPATISDSPSEGLAPVSESTDFLSEELASEGGEIESLPSESATFEEEVTPDVAGNSEPEVLEIATVQEEPVKTEVVVEPEKTPIKDLASNLKTKSKSEERKKLAKKLEERRSKNQLRFVR